MNKLKAFATILLSAFGIFGANEYYKPRNMQQLLKWRGVKIASDDRAWKSMFFEHQDELQKMNIKDEKELWTWCGEKFKGTNLNDETAFQEAKKYCSDNPISIMARIIREGEETKLIKDDDKVGFSINYLVSSNKEAVLKLIGYTEKSLTEVDLEKVAEKLEIWCQGQKRTNITSSEELDKFSEFKKRCYDVGVRNFKQLLRKQGRKLINSPDKFRKKLVDDNLQYAPELIAKLEKVLENEDKKKLVKSRMISSRDKGLEIKDGHENAKLDLKELLRNNHFLEKIAPLLYKSYCDSQWDKSLIKQKDDLKEFAEVSSRCTEGESN